MNQLRVTCREVVKDLQKLYLSRRLEKEQSELVVEIMRKLRLSMRKDYERQRFKAAVDRLHRKGESSYPTA
ncbi:MAG: hypothetical protein ACYTF6_08035 [Planctomycetota bacterium]